MTPLELAASRANDTAPGYGFSVLVVEDDEQQLLVTAGLLRQQGFEVTAVREARDAVQLIQREEPHAIVCDFGLPDMDGGQFLEYVRLQHGQIAFLMLTGHDDVQKAVRTMRAGADEYLVKPVPTPELTTKILDSIEHRANVADIARREREPILNIYRGVASLVTSLEEKDAYTKNHSRKVERVSSMIAQALPDITRRQMQEIRFGARLHDVGKIAVPLTILHKEGPLDDEEWEVIKHHPVAGGRIVKHISRDFPEVWRIVRYEHERWDGKGYTEGLAGEQIPLGSRLVMIADTYDAVCSDRSYRKALSKDEATRIIRDGAGGQFDPGLVPLFEKVVHDLPHPDEE